VWTHPHHPGNQCVDLKTQVFEHISHQVVVLVAVAAAAPAYQLVGQRIGAEVEHRHAEQGVEILERNVASVRGHQLAQRLQRGVRGPGIPNTSEIRRHVHVWLGRGIRRFRGQVPVQRGGRFSANAIAPSLASLDENTGIRSLFCSANLVSGLQPRDSTMICLVAATASGPLAVIFSAKAIAASSAAPGSASTLTIPSACARSAVKFSPVSANSIAMAAGMRSGSRSSPPPPATRPRLTSGMPNAASLDATIRSVASASSVPPASA